MDGKHSLAIGAVAVLTAAIAACSGAAPAPSSNTHLGGGAPSSLKATLATATGGGDDEQNFVTSAASLSSGAIDITISANWRGAAVDSEAGLVKDVAGGKAELGLISARGFDTAGVNSFDGLQAPMLIDSYELEAKVLAADWATKLLDGPRSVGVVGLGYIQGELRQPLGITHDMVQVSDFKGARIGFRPSHVAEMTIQALGATAGPQPASFDLAGLDGIEMGAPGVAGNDFNTSAVSFTGNVVLWPRPNIIFANAKWFDALPTDQQAQLRAAVAADDQLAITRLPDNEREARDKFCVTAGFSIKEASTQELDALRQRLQPVIDEMSKDPATKATIDAITALRTSSGFAPFALAPCSSASASQSANSGPTPLDGTWKTSYTKADLINSPFNDDPGSINDGNWGDFTYTFANGRFTATQTNPIESSSGSGLFIVTGDVIHLSDAGSGETFVYRWSIYKNTLTFKRDNTIGPGPLPMLVKPWTLVP
jgi:TRAP-type C4-dicarboxylate transport system substrate-binding protein